MPSNNKVLNGDGLGHLITKIKDEIEDSKEVYIGPTEPTGDEVVWINPDGEESPIVTKDYVDGEIERVEGEIPSLDGYATEEYVDTEVATKSEVSVSDTGTATDEVQYITIDGVEKKLAGGGAPDNMVTTDTAQTITGTKTFTNPVKIDTLRNGTANDWLMYNNGNPVMSSPRGDLTLESFNRPKWFNPDSFTTKQLATTDQIPTVVANPTTTTDTLTGITIGDTSYAISGGSGSSYTFTNGLTESGGTVSWDLNDKFYNKIRLETGDSGITLNKNTIYHDTYMCLGEVTGTDSYLGGSSNTNNGGLTVGYVSSRSSIISSRSGSIAVGGCSGKTGNTIKADAQGTIAVGFLNGIGLTTSAGYQNSQAFGDNVRTGAKYQMVIGRNNVVDSTSAFIIGNGVNSSNLSNALTVSQDGIIQCTNIPAPPTSDGSYNLHLDIIDGVPTYTWKAEV